MAFANGYGVDRGTSTLTSIYYGAAVANIHGLTSFVPGNGRGKSAFFRDAPGIQVGRRSQGYEFITAIVGIKNGAAPEFVGAFKWAYYVDQEGKKVITDNLIPTFIKDVPDELGKAISIWNALPGLQIKEGNEVIAPNPLNNLTGVTLPKYVYKP